jgi:virulence-associated protein VapD
MFSLQLVF